MDQRLAAKFGKTLRKHRESTGLSQEALAFACDLDRTYISLLERGLRQPSLTTIFVLADELAITPEQFVAEIR